MQNQTQKCFIFNGLLMLLIAMIFPFYSPWAHTQEGILKVHLIGTLEAILFFVFSWLWPQLTPPKLANQLAIVLIYISFWSNIIGCMLIAILGINIAVHFFLSCSEYIIIPILVALLNFRTKPYSTKASTWLNSSMLTLTILLTALIIWQTFSHF